MIELGANLDGKYSVKGRLGSGAFGEVFVAEDILIPGRQVALKVLTTRSPGGRKDLLREMRTLAGFHLPGVVLFYHHLEHAEQLVLVMEFCAGGSLHSRIAGSGPMRVDEVFRHAVVLCDTLGAVHEKGIVHHDIKPANILFSLDGAIKIGDFGIANRGMGTRRYMTPEQLQGEAVEVNDRRIDIYALGLTLLEMLTGDPPFAGLTDDQAIIARRLQDFVPRNLPQWVQDVVLRATHPTPERRFQTTVEFAEAIKAKYTPVLFERKHIDAQLLANKADKSLKRKHWKHAEKYSNQALHLAPDSIPALIVAGRMHLSLRRAAQAREVFTVALRRNPRIHVQKELGWLHLEEGNLSMAVSLLTDHLDRNAGDWEAGNLLLKALYLAGRYEDAEGLAGTIQSLKTGNDCFHSNRFPCQVLLGRLTADWFDDQNATDIQGPFLLYNFCIAKEYLTHPEAYPAHYLKHKLLFQEYGFESQHKTKSTNKLSVRLRDGTLWESDKAVITVGSALSNDVVVDAGDVSRQHGLLVNLPHEVWYYDLGSSCGSMIDNKPVESRVFLEGVHSLKVASRNLEIAARSGLLV